MSKIIFLFLYKNSLSSQIIFPSFYKSSHAVLNYYHPYSDLHNADSNRKKVLLTHEALNLSKIAHIAHIMIHI